MTRKRSRIVAFGVVIAQVAFLACGSSAAQATTVITAQQRTAFEQSMARYERLESSTSPAEVRSQMRATEAAIEPCVPQLKQLYDKETALPKSSESFTIILGRGVEDGERWNATAAIRAALVLGDNGNANEAKRYIAEVVTPVTKVDTCGVLDKWSGEDFAYADGPKIFAALDEAPGVSPYAAIGSRAQITTFTDWGIRKNAAKQGFDDLTTATARYSMLNALASTQFIDWLRQQGVYQLMLPGYREVMKWF
jgi:hypothetical protein